ncbi:MAG: class I SAM-dependent methyltransferase [Spirochaetota bacterium]
MENYNEEYFASDSIKDEAFLKKYISLIEESGVILNNKSILDVGCANGELVRILSQTNTCYGIDISDIAIQNAKKHNSGMANNLLCHDLGKADFPLNIEFHVITMFDVIEHFHNFSYLQTLINTNLKTGGYLIVTTPNAHSLQRFVVGNEKFVGEKDPTHVLLFTAYTLDFFLRRLGLQKKELFCGFGFYLKNNFLTRTFPLGAQIFAIYEKVENRK